MIDYIPPKRGQFAFPMTCLACGHAGNAIWEENVILSPEGPRPTLISLPAGFRLNTVGHDTGRPEVVCERCGALVEDY
jgi:hypothetical protein